MHVEEPQLERRRLPFLDGQLVLFDLDFLDDFLDAGGVDAAVRDQPFDGLLRHFAAEGIEARQDDGSGGVVDDELDAGGLLEGADVPALAADDAPLEIVAGQVDDRNRGLDGVFGGAALDRLGDDLLRLLRRHLAGLRLETLDEVGGVAAGLLLDLLDDEILRLVGGEAGNALQGLLLLAEQLVAAPALGGEGAVPFVERLMPFTQHRLRALGLAILLRQLLGPARELPLDGRQLVPPLLALTLAVLQQGVGLFLRGEFRLLPVGVGLSAGVTQEPFRRLLRLADGLGGAFAGDDPRAAHDERGEYDDHRQQQARGRDKVHGWSLGPRGWAAGGRGERQTNRRGGQPLDGRRRLPRPAASAAGRRTATPGEVRCKAPHCRVGRSNEPAKSRWSRSRSNQLRFALPRAEACAPRSVAAHWDIALAQTILRNHHEHCRDLVNPHGCQPPADTCGRA